MSDGGVNQGRRRLLVAATSVIGAVGVAGAAIPFIKSCSPSARVNISKLEPGRQIVIEWRGQPVFVLRRGADALERLSRLENQLADPDSHDSIQPDYVNSRLRSIRPDVLVVVGVCTHLGCSPIFRPEVAPADLGTEWLGGYFCPCHGSRYDLAGRVYKAQPAPLNLVVPPYAYESEHIIVIGMSQKEAG